MRAVSPKGSPIERTLEHVMGTNGVLNFSRTSQGHLQFEYDSSAMEVDWDTAEPICRHCEDGVFRTIFIDAAGDEWTSDQILFVDDDAIVAVEGRGDTFAIIDQNEKVIVEIPYVEEVGIEAIDTASGMRARKVANLINAGVTP